MKELWVEKYRPNTVDGYVFRDEHQKKQVKQWIKEGTIPHLLFSGNAGIGKTTLAKILFNELEINDLDILEINASRTNSVEDVRDKIVNFVQMIPFGDFKVVLLDEADYLSPNAQAALRGVMEEYHTTSRFILTCNYPNRIIPALHSRCQGFHIERIDQTEFTARVAQILIDEGVQPDLDTLDTFVKATYPDLRKCINMVQMNSVDGVLQKPQDGDTGEADYKLEMVELFKAGKINQARKLVCSQVRPDEVEDIYKWLYDNITLFGDEEKQDNAILIIKQGLVDHTLVADPEINLAATMIRLARL
jgi:DNA polymerase III delta prime subunit|tara:strand:- start:8024 stop:8938 length:915 start_codon:yes stop_codon:yes gene_type:complete